MDAADAGVGPMLRTGSAGAAGAHVQDDVPLGRVPFVFFTVSIGKQPRYILPILPPLALLLATQSSSDGRREVNAAIRWSRFRRCSSLSFFA